MVSISSPANQSPPCAGVVTWSLPCVPWQVNVLPELMAAFSDAGGGLCGLFTRPRPGEPGASQLSR